MILITRPEIDSLFLAEKLNNMSIDCCILPLIKITYNNIIESSFPCSFYSIKNIIITSKNALRAIASIIDKNLYLNIVGQSTADLAYSLGFMNINLVGEDVYSLIFKLRDFYPDNSEFIYFRGNVISADLKEILKNKFLIHDFICYNSHKNADIDDKLADLISSGIISSILFFSKKTATYFLESIENIFLSHKLKNIIAITLSSNINSVLSKLQWRRIITTSSPSEKAIISIIKELYYGRI